MAKQNDVNINIKTKTDARALDKVRRKMADLNKSIKGSSKEATKQMSEEEKAAKKAADALKLLNKQKNQAEKEAYQHARALEKEEKAAQRAAKANSNVAKETTKAGKSSSKAGNSILYASQAFEDLQYGIRGVLNNIPQLIMSLGGTAGLAGVISIVAVVASKLGGAFNMAKTATKSLSDAISEFDTDKLDKIKASKKDLENQANYTKAIDEETAALKKNTTAVSANAEAKQLERKLELEQAKVQAKLDKLRVEQGGGSELDKQTKLAAIRERMAILTNQDEEATRRENIGALETARSGAISQAGAQSVAAGELERTIPTREQIDKTSAKSLSAGKLFDKSVSSIRGSQGSGMANMLSKFLREVNNERMGFRDKEGAEAKLRRQESAVKFMNSKIDDLASAIVSGNEELQRISLQGIVDIAKGNERQRQEDISSGVVGKDSKFGKMDALDRQLNTQSARAKRALSSMGKRVTLETKATDLAAEREQKKSDVQRLREGATTAAQSAGELTKRIEAERKILASVKERRKTEKEIRDIQNQTQAAAAAAEDKAKADKIKAEQQKLRDAESARRERQEAAGVEVVDRLGKFKRSLPGDYSGADSFIRGASNGQTGDESQALKDFLIKAQANLSNRGVGSSETMRILKDLISLSQKQANDALIENMELKKLRKQVQDLTNNAKRQEK